MHLDHSMILLAHGNGVDLFMCQNMQISSISPKSKWAFSTPRCLGRRKSSIDTIRSEVKSWGNERNRKINCLKLQFKTDDARIKLSRLSHNLKNCAASHSEDMGENLIGYSTYALYYIALPVARNYSGMMSWTLNNLLSANFFSNPPSIYSEYYIGSKRASQRRYSARCKEFLRGEEEKYSVSTFILFNHDSQNKQFQR